MHPQTSIQLPWRKALYFTKPSTNIKGISLFLKTINNKMIFTKFSDITAWERKLGTSSTPTQWQKALQSTYSATKSVNLWELTQKILLRWYLTPLQISKFDIYTSPLCWRKCGAISTLYHILWDCPHIRTLWSRVFDLLAQILNLRIPISQGLALLSLGIEFLHITIRTIVIHTLLSIRLSIMRHWKNCEIPTLKEVIITTKTHTAYKLMFASSQGRYHTANTQWILWTDWYKLKRVADHMVY